MKNIKNITDRQAMYRIEAARITYIILKESYEDLTKTLRKMEIAGHDFAISVIVFRNAWQFIDNSYRFSTLISQIKGLRHKDERFKAVAKSMVQIEKARNFIQHLNSGIPKLSDETYPILGAISWASEDKKESYTLSVGALPKGTQFHSLGYNTEEKNYNSDIQIDVNNFSV